MGPPHNHSSQRQALNSLHQRHSVRFHNFLATKIGIYSLIFKFLPNAFGMKSVWDMTEDKLNNLCALHQSARLVVMIYIDTTL